jgi:hypothetical protein
MAAQGWQCPICGRVYSPLTTECDKCNRPNQCPAVITPWVPTSPPDVVPTSPTWPWPNRPEWPGPTHTVTCSEQSIVKPLASK